MRRAVLVGLGITGALTAPLAAPDSARVETCRPTGRATAHVAPGVVITWDSSFACVGVPAQGLYEARLSLLNGVESSEPVRVDRIVLSHTTPRPGGRGPEASLEQTGLPADLTAGAGREIIITGRYELVRTDEGDKANLHLAAVGETAAGRPFRLGVNVHFRGPGARE